MYRFAAELRASVLTRDDNATRHALMAAGEHLMGEQGLDTPPLHAIAIAAGQANKYAVQYHFGDRKGLVSAILLRRNVAIGARRAELALVAAGRGLLGDVDALVEAMFLPIVEQVGETQPRSFARLLLLALTLPWEHDLMRVRGDVTEDPPTAELLASFGRALPHLTPATIGWRLRIQSRQVLNCLVEHDNLRRMGKAVEREAELVQATLAMAAAAMRAS